MDLDCLDATVLADRNAIAHWGDKAIAPVWYGRTWGEISAAGIEASQLPTPCLTLDQQVVSANISAFHQWCAEHGVALSPHGKTTMAPALWAQQLRAGAWGSPSPGRRNCGWPWKPACPASWSPTSSCDRRG